MYPNAVRFSSAQQKVWNFAHGAQFYGMPVKMLASVGTSCLIFQSGSNTFYTNLNAVSLTPATLNGIAHPAPNGKLGMGEIRALYHETTHAYLDRQSNKAHVAAVMTTAENYYRGAPLKGGGTVTDPYRVAQEAAAEYVGHRAETFWRALDLLEMERQNATGPNPPNDMRKRIQDIRDDYDHTMLQITFGYQNGRGTQLTTTKSMPNTLQHFCDRALLEHKIPSIFSQSQTLE